MKRFLKKVTPTPVIKAYKNYKIKKVERGFIGNSVVCTICHSTYSEFGVFGLHLRQNAKCHRCGALERHRLIWKYLKEKSDVFNKDITMLHFAPEPMFYERFSKLKNITYYPCDLQPELYDYIGNVKIRPADITDIPFESNTFDFILCSHVLEHIPDDRKAMSELFRVMKPGGFGIFQVPIDYNREKTYEDFSITSLEEREKAFGQNDHVRWYGKDYKDRLENVGFEVTEDDYVMQFSADEQFKFGFIASEYIYNCKKT